MPLLDIYSNISNIINTGKLEQACRTRHAVLAKKNARSVNGMTSVAFCTSLVNPVEFRLSSAPF